MCLLAEGIGVICILSHRETHRRLRLLFLGQRVGGGGEAFCCVWVRPKIFKLGGWCGGDATNKNSVHVPENVLLNDNVLLMEISQFLLLSLMCITNETSYCQSLTGFLWFNGR